ncbi:hypothetical protein [Streptosporangium saharense]|uniref:hypothetical protein n=1 Tax=Streptosporangium saharense TaxID=1706840 RepID=UPI0034221091
MSEVVPLPSFGEVFFDERGQERVLRVTWHEGTLVLSLWRGEMCTASFRMPMNDVGRLVDTLDEGFVEAGGQYPDEVGEPVGQGGAYQDPNGFPGTGQYARPVPEDYASPPQYPDPAATQVVPMAEEPRPAALSPTDVLVARGTVPPPPAQQPPAGYGPDGVVPRENMIVNDSLSYGHSAEQAGHGQAEPVYQMPGDLYPPQQPAYGGAAPQGYGAQQPQDPYGTPPQDPYGTARQPDPYATAPAQPDPFAAPAQQPDPFVQQHRPDPYGAAPQQPVDPYGAAPQQPVDPYGAAPQGQRHADPYTQAGMTDPSGFTAPSYNAPPNSPPQPDPYGGYPPPAQPDPYAYGARQAGHPADLRDLYGSPGYQEQQPQQPAYQEPPAYQQDVDPSDPLGIFGGQQQERRSRSRSQDAHSTGERLRPDREERRDW